MAEVKPIHFSITPESLENVKEVLELFYFKWVAVLDTLQPSQLDCGNAIYQHLKMAKALHYRDSKIDMKYCFELSSHDYDTFTK